MKDKDKIETLEKAVGILTVTAHNSLLGLNKRAKLTKAQDRFYEDLFVALVDSVELCRKLGEPDVNRIRSSAKNYARRKSLKLITIK